VRDLFEHWHESPPLPAVARAWAGVKPVELEPAEDQTKTRELDAEGWERMVANMKRAVDQMNARPGR
jgi:hypothetical protein